MGGVKEVVDLVGDPKGSGRGGERIAEAERRGGEGVVGVSESDISSTT